MTSAKSKKDEILAVTADELRNQLHLKKMVGRGGFAAVYLGIYKGQEVAVKVILAEHSFPESSQVKLLLREGQYMSRCTHRSILKCHAVCQLPADFPGIEDLGHRSSTWALVLEYIGGGSLADLLKRHMSQTRRTYTDYDAYCWIRDVAEALSYLHNAPRPVMHRDVKADNVLLTVDETGRPTAKLMDFGLMAALDGKNPMLRRRSVSASAGGDSLGRTSATSIARVSMSGNRNLSAPSVATYYNDSTHEAGKIFYLMEELPAPTVAALPGPAALRRVSVDFTARNAGSNSGANSSAGPSTPGGMTSPAGQYGSTTVASRGNSFDGGGGGFGATTTAGSLAWGPKVRSNLAPATPGSFGTLVPLSEEASYHGNTAGYAAMLLLQQQQRQQEQRQRRASQDAATATAAIGGAAATASSSLPNSLHGACSGSSPLNGSSLVGGVSPQPGLSPLRPVSPSSNTHCQGDGLGAGSVRLRLLSDQDGGGTFTAPTGGGDAAAARLNRQVPERNGSLVRMSAPQPSGLTAPPTGAVLVEDESPPDTEVDCAVLRNASMTCNSAATNAMHAHPQFKLPDDTLQPHHQQFQQQQQLRASRPNSSVKLPPIIAVAKHAAAPAAAGPDAANGAGPCSGSVAAGDSAPLGPGSGGLRGDEGLGLASGVVTRERRASLHDAVPLVAVGGDNAADSVVVSGHGRRSRVGMIPSTPVAAAAPLSGVHAQVVTPSPLGDAQGNGGGGSAAAITQLVERESSQRSIDSNRSGTGNGFLPCGPADGGGTASSSALSKLGGGASAGAGAGGQLSIAALLQGRYEQDFQWVWRLTGQTGSCMYMAPEVFRNMPYNEKVDVFSFGVLMYEVFARTLLLVSGLLVRDLRLKCMDTPEGYAQYVADGYRPPKPLSMPEPLYQLISACWADDPCTRPNMTDVVETLKLLQDQYAPLPTSSAPSCGCVIS